MATRPIRARPETYEPDALGITAAYIIPVGMSFPETPEQVIKHVFDNILHIRSNLHVPTSPLCLNLHDNGMFTMQSLLTLSKDWWDTDLIYVGRTGGRFAAITANDRIVMKNLIDYYNANIHFNGGEALDSSGRGVIQSCSQRIIHIIIQYLLTYNTMFIDLLND
jgi:hypothetical protein